jgi:pimeloyl-ACP methyl ester carboxylesterase
MSFSLIHGGLHGAWCWDALTPFLEKAGHIVLAPDLPGMGNGKTPVTELTLERWGEFVADLARKQPRPSVLVGHSRGGIVISEAAERAPAYIGGLVCLSAMLIEDGQSMMGAAETMLPHLAPNMQASDDGLAMSYAEDAAYDTFYNKTDAVTAAAAIARLTPEAIAPNVTPVRLTPERFGRIRRAW